MIAPENIDPEGYTDMGCGCGRLYSYGGHVEPGQHDPDCPVSLSLELVRLQARWDARDEALRALIEQWRAGAVIVRTDETDGERYRSVVTVGLDTVADELEQALQERRHEL